MWIDIRLTKLFKGLPFLNWSKNIAKVEPGPMIWVCLVRREEKALGE